jgi:L-seryl-tRNA(Ser) seleniumtransferase
MIQEELRRLPSVNDLLGQPEIEAIIQHTPRALVVAAARPVLERARARIRDGAMAPDIATLAEAVRAEVTQRLRPSLRPVINATGVIINTNLGRAPLSARALAAIYDVARGYTNLEYDLAAGERGSRHEHLRATLRELTGAEDCLVANNNAAAVLLVLSALAAGREVVVSRGQLVEIGGGFRVPDVLRQSGARLVEVGTTNRTRRRDYEQAIGPETAALLAVHPSNFRIIGFTESVPPAELAALAHERGLIAVEDLGSGALLDTAPYGLSHEPTPRESIAAGVDIVCFSGDKVLGGPQAGIIIGRTELISCIGRHPLMRALRVDKLTIAALTATAQHYLLGEATEALPIWRMIATPLAELRARAAGWAAQVRAWGFIAEVVDGESTVGGGSLPGETLPTALLALPQQARLASSANGTDRPPLEALAARLRAGDPPVVARIFRDRLLLDPRTVLPDQDAALLRALQAALEGLPLQRSIHPGSTGGSA